MPLGNAQQPVLSGSEQHYINNICCQIEHNIISTTYVVRLCCTIGQTKVSLGNAQQPVLSGSEQHHINNLCCQIEHNIISTTCVFRL